MNQCNIVHTLRSGNLGQMA